MPTISMTSRVRRIAPDGQSEVIDLALGVTDIRYEPHGSNAAGWTYKFTYAQVRPLIEAQAGWTEEEKPTPDGFLKARHLRCQLPDL